MAKKPSLSADFRVRGLLHALDCRVVLLPLLLFVCLVHQTDGAEYMTMVTPAPYGAGLSASFTCFRTRSNDGVTLSFARPFQIGLAGSTIQMSTTLPVGYTSNNYSQAEAKSFSNNNDAVGVFYCQGGNDTRSRVYSIIHSVIRKFEPQDGLVTRTMNSGESVTLTVTSYNNEGTLPIWHRIRYGVVTDITRQFSTTIPSSNAINGDVYAVIQSAARLEDNHFSMIRLIVRGCAEGKWGPGCTGICDMCYNGGVCDDKTGQCICAPGFSGTNCLTACGQDIFGWNCDLQCGSGHHDITICAGSQFGLPDPYGNSCISGYTGIQCTTACSAGTFGAGCSQMCHCQSGTCNKYTGVCDGGVCATGWSGGNCQIPETCPLGYYGSDCTSKCHCHLDEACDETNGICNSGCASGKMCKALAITCANRVPLYGIPETTIDVTIPQPTLTVTGGISDVTFTYYILISGSSLQISNPYRTSVPMSGTAYLSFTVVTNAFGIQRTCTYTTMITAFAMTCMDSMLMYGDPGSTINVEIPDPTVSEGISGVTFSYSYGSSSITNSYPVTVPMSGITTVDVTITGYHQTSGLRRSCVYSIMVTGFAITCATGIPVFGNPGSTIDVTIPEPTVLGATSGVNFYVTHSSLASYKAISIPLQVPVPTTGNMTLTVRVDAIGPSNARASCMYSTTVTGLPQLSQSPLVSVTPSSASVSWQAWGVHQMDAGTGPVTQYNVYYSPASSLDWISAGNITVTDLSQDMYSFVIEPLAPDTQYAFSVSAVSEGGEGPLSPEARGMILVLTTGESTTVASTSSKVTPTKQPSTSSSTYIIIMIVCLILLVGIIVAIAIYLKRRRRRNEQTAVDKPSVRSQGMEMNEKDLTSGTETTAPDYERVGGDETLTRADVSAPSTYEDVGLPAWAQSYSIPWEKLTIGENILGSGNFGEVLEAVVFVKGGFTKAAIKTLKANASVEDRQNFMEEFKTLTQVAQHPNVVGIIGACQHKDDLYVATEYLPNGDLRSYLRNARGLGCEGQGSVTSRKLVQFALDIAKGMQHLAALGVIHRDLAARNILLNDTLVAKVSDFGLSRGEDIYVQTSQTRVPTRWLSLESLLRRVYTSKSDVWSFGVLLWEIATLGATPYEGIKSQSLASRLENGYRIPKPSNCDDPLYDMMVQCWQEDPNERPSFKKLATTLSAMNDSKEEHQYVRLLPAADSYMYLMIRPERDDK